MATTYILQLLISERDKLNRAIEALETPARRRGGPPKVAASTAAAPVPKPKRGGMSRAARLAQSRRMKEFWAERRATKTAKPQRRPRMSAAARKAASLRMKRYWAARRKTKKAPTK